jgi:hypothetical protein
MRIECVNLHTSSDGELDASSKFALLVPRYGLRRGLWHGFDLFVYLSFDLFGAMTIREMQEEDKGGGALDEGATGVGTLVEPIIRSPSKVPRYETILDLRGFSEMLTMLTMGPDFLCDPWG